MKYFQRFAAMLVCATSAVVPAYGQSPDGAEPSKCAVRYHKSLQTLASERAEILAGLFQNLRTGDATLPGRWLVATDGKGGAKSGGRVETVCVEEKKVAGRNKCLRYEDRPVGAKDVAYSVAVDAADVKMKRQLTDFVLGRSALAEVGDNGRYTWLVQRMAQDLRLYVMQPLHPGLCAGGRELAEFYDSQLEMLKKRRDDVAVMATGARARALKLTRTVAGLAAGRATVGDGDDGEPGDDAPKGEAASEATVATAIAAIRPDASAQVLIGAAIKPLVSADNVASVTGEATALGALGRAKSLLMDSQGRDGGGDAASRKAEREAVGQALLALELSIYADMQKARYGPLSRAVLDVPGEILQANVAACTCDK